MHIQGRKGGGGSAHTPVEAPDDLLSTAKLKMLLAIAEGEIQGELTAQQIFLNDTALANADGSYNFSGVVWDWRRGTQDQTYIPGMPEIDNELAVGVTVTQSVPWTRQFTNLTLDAVRIKLSLPAQYRYKDNGDMVGTVTAYAIDLSTDGGAYQTVVDTTFDGKTTSEYQRDHRINLPDATTGWAVRVRRITADSAGNSKLVNAFKVFSCAEVIDSKLRYPNTALLYIEVDASHFNGSAPKVTCIPQGRRIRVPSNYDPVTRESSGAWAGDFKWAYSNNPAWVFYDLVLDKIFGMGNRVDASMIDKWEVYAIAQYCDERVSDGAGGTEPRFTCNVYIQSQQDAYTVLKDLAAIFRGITFWGNEQIYVNADVPVADLDFVYTASNVVDGLFNYAGGSYKNRYSSCLVSWSDPQNHYSDTIEGVYDSDLVARYDINQTQLTAIGCTSQSEAHRRGRWVLLSNAKDGTISFNVGLDGHIPLPASVIGVADPFRAGMQNGGRISAVNGRNIMLDRAVEYAPGDRLALNLPDGTTQTRTISAISSDKKTVTVSTDYRMVPIAGAVWAIDSDRLAIQQFRVTSVAANDDGTFNVSGVQHDPNKYRFIDDGVRITPAPITVTPISVLPSPKNILISQTDFIDQGLTVASLNSTWDKVDGAVRYQAQWRKDNGDWINVPVASAQGFSVQGIYSGNYDVRVRALNAQDSSSPWGYADTTHLTGKNGTPGTPQSLLASNDVVWAIDITWAFPDGAGDTAYTELQRATTDDKANPELLTLVPYPSASYQHGPMLAGVRQWYRARLVDRIGNVGEWTTWVMGQSSVDVSAISAEILEQMKDTAVFKDIIENAVETSKTVADLATAITQNADQLAAAVGANRQTAEAIIGNALAIADVVVRQSAQNGANSASFTQLREVIATETQARVTDVTRLEAKTDQNAAQVTQLTQALSDETQARATAVDTLTAQTQDNTANVTQLTQTVSTLDSATASRFDELSGKTANAAGGVQNTAVALIQETLAQVSQQVKQSVQYGANVASIQRVESVVASSNESIAQSLLQLRTDVAGNTSTINSLSQSVSNYQQASATQINSLSVTVNGHTSSIATNAQALADISGNLNAMYSIKVGVDANGRQYAAGMGLGVQNTPGGMQSQVVFLADRFAVMSQAGAAVSLPFVIQNGQTFINDAFFRDASIQFGKITDSLKSDNFVSGPNGAGWNLPKSGNAELNNVTVRGNGEFTGKITATSGTFKGTVQADAFIGDVANAQVFADGVEDSVSQRTFTYSDSDPGAREKHITIMAMISLRNVQTNPSDTAVANVTLAIGSSTKTFSIATTKFASTMVTVMHSARITANTINCSIQSRVPVGATYGLTQVHTPTMMVARGSGAFVQTN
ncbi:phage tail protein [Phytobacter diazotrophicus]|uniref:phage tail protein n=1 Tax=Phytobacter diazotrophicus TaxID=395631 RepID=UPI0009A79237|nr:Phage-related protein, tail component [Enterobacter sp. NFR05]